MRLRRSGARRFEGWTNIFDGKPKLHWDEKDSPPRDRQARSRPGFLCTYANSHPHRSSAA